MLRFAISLALLFGFAGSALAASTSRNEESAAIMAMAAKDYDGSIQHYAKAIALETDQLHLAQLYNQRGSAYDLKGFYDQAIADINQAIALKPDYDLAYRTRGRVYAHKALYDQALADANKSIALAEAARAAEPSADATYHSSAAFVARAEIYELLGHRDNAIADYRQALSLQPNMRSAKNGLTHLGVTP